MSVIHTGLASRGIGEKIVKKVEIVIIILLFSCSFDEKNYISSGRPPVSHQECCGALVARGDREGLGEG